MKGGYSFQHRMNNNTHLSLLSFTNQVYEQNFIYFNHFRKEIIFAWRDLFSRAHIKYYSIAYVGAVHAVISLSKKTKTKTKKQKKKNTEHHKCAKKIEKQKITEGKEKQNAAKNSPEIVEHTASKSNGQHVLLKNQFLWA